MKNAMPTPPKWADQFLVWFVSEDLIEEIQGDLHEAYYARAAKYGRTAANRQFIADVFQFFKPYAFEKYSRAKQFLPMFDNYFKIALRNILHLGLHRKSNPIQIQQSFRKHGSYCRN